MAKTKHQGTNGVSRREILVGAGAAALSSTALLGRPPFPGGRAVKRKTTNMHLSLAAYSVRDALTDGRMDLFQFVDWCAELGLAGTEPTTYYFQENFDSAYLRRLRNRAFRNGVTISGTAIRNDFCMPPGTEKDAEINQVKRWIDYAADLFAPHIRIFGGEVPQGATNEQGIQWVADGILGVLDHAARRGVVIGLENHGGITSRAADVLAICEKVGEHPWFGVNLDTGNFRTNCYQELAMVAPLAVNVQLKVEIQQGDRQVPADFNKIHRILKDSGYSGWVALEYEAAPDPFVEVPKYLEQLRKLFEA